MISSQKRIFAIVLILCTVLSLLLTACNSGGETPTGDNSSPGVSSTETPSNTPDTTDATPDDTAEPDDTPSEADPSTSDASEAPTDEKQYGMPTWADPSTYDEEKKAFTDEQIAYQFGSELDIDKLISEVIDEYGEYIDVHITPEAVRIATVESRKVAVRNGIFNVLTGMSESSLTKVNDYLQSTGKEPLNIVWADIGHVDEQTSKNSIAALAIGASLCYEVNRDGYSKPLWDLGKAFDGAFDITSGLGQIGAAVMQDYYVLTD